MKPVRALRPIVKQIVPQRVRDEVRKLIRATPAAGIYTLESDEAAWIDEEVALLGDGPWHQPRSRKSTAGMSERVVEIPWVLSRYRGERRVLDVGTVWARPAYKQKLVSLGIPELNGVDLAEGTVDGVRMTKADVRQLPYRDGSIDLIICVSTLEHIGLDNTVYGASSELEESGDASALREFRRVLAPRGRVLITIPIGLRQRLDWLRQYDKAQWEGLLKTTRLEASERAIYTYSDVRGWRRASRGNFPHKAFQEDGAPAATGVLCAELRRAS